MPLLYTYNIMNKPTIAKILEGASNTELRIKYFKEKAPYFPEYYLEVGADEFSNTVFHLTCKVRHKHNGTWYAKHHYHTEIADDLEKPLQNFLREVYLDLKFGKINPDLIRQNGEPLDPVDDIQQSERERLGI